jgi:hydrogenase-4 component E
MTVLIYLCTAALLLSGILIAALRDLHLQVSILRVQGFSLGLVPLFLGIEQHSWALIVAGIVEVGIRGTLLPWLLFRTVRRLPPEPDPAKERNTASSFLLSGLLAVSAYLLFLPITRLTLTSLAQSSFIGLALILIGIQVLLMRRRAIGQIVGFLMIDNGIDTFGFLATLGVPFVLELGISLDLIFVILILAVLASRMVIKFEGTDVDDLSALREE